MYDLLGEITDHAVGRLDSLCLAVQLVAKPLDVVHAIRNDNVVTRQHPLYSGVLFSASILLSLCGMVDIARHTQRLIVNVVNFEATDSRISRGVGDLGFEEFLELECTCCLARGGVAGDEDELHARVSAIKRDGGQKGHPPAFSTRFWVVDIH
jgi:hypothetical protein